MVSSAAVIVDQAVAGMLGSGGVSELAYGNKLVSVLLAISAAALSTSVLPVFSRLAAIRDWRGLRRIVTTYSAVALAVSVPVTAILFVWSPTIVRIFYQHGAFHASATEIVANIQRCALLQIPFAIVLALVMKVVIAISANALLARVAIAGFAINLICDFAFAHWIGIAGIALATAVVQFLSLVIFAIVLARRCAAADRDPYLQAPPP
jgi:putative peptidoglycan lipid II flippase